jgi:hypothetical protein
MSKPRIEFERVLCAVYLLSIGLLNIVIINPIIGLNRIDQKIEFPYPISRFAPMYCATK